jgi:hypothetical protein
VPDLNPKDFLATPTFSILTVPLTHTINVHIYTVVSHENVAATGIETVRLLQESPTHAVVTLGSCPAGEPSAYYSLQRAAVSCNGTLDEASREEGVTSTMAG